MSSSNGRTRPSFTSHSRSATSSTRCGSWLTRITAPPYSVSASTSASRLSMSRWLVGSSRMIICGASSAASKSDSRVFCPPDSRPTSVVTMSAPIPPAASRPRSFPGGSSGLSRCRCCKRRLVELELVHLVLGEIPHSQLRGRHLPPAHRRQPVGQELRQRRLPLPVLPEERDPVVLVDPQIQVAQDRPPVIPDRHLLQPDDRRRQLLRLGKVERRHLVLDYRGDRLHPLQRLDPALRLPRLRRLGPEAIDEGLHVRPRRVLLALLGDELLQPRPPRVLESVVRALVEHELPPVEVQDRPHRPVQEIPVVADDEHRMRIARQKRLQPDRAFQVEIVRRLVEQQHVRPREQHRRQRHPHPPAAGELRAGPPLRRRIEPEPVQDRRRPRLRRMRVDVGQPGMDLGDPVRVLRTFRLRHQRRALHVRLQHRVDQARPRRRRLLRHAADPRPPRHLDLAAVERRLAADQPEERRLAAAVPPDESHLVPRRDQRRGILEELLSLDGEADVLEGEHGRGCDLPPPPCQPSPIAPPLTAVTNPGAASACARSSSFSSSPPPASLPSSSTTTRRCG